MSGKCPFKNTNYIRNISNISKKELSLFQLDIYITLKATSNPKDFITLADWIALLKFLGLTATLIILTYD